MSPDGVGVADVWLAGAAVGFAGAVGNASDTGAPRWSAVVELPDGGEPAGVVGAPGGDVAVAEGDPPRAAAPRAAATGAAATGAATGGTAGVAAPAVEDDAGPDVASAAAVDAWGSGVAVTRSPAGGALADPDGAGADGAAGLSFSASFGVAGGGSGSATV